MLDWQIVLAVAAPVITAVGAVYLGINTGRITRRKDESEAEVNRDKARLERERAEDDASRVRVEAIAADLARARDRLRASEEESDIKLIAIRRDRDRGWDLARHHFAILSVVAHFLNNLLCLASMSASPERILESMKNTQERMASVRIPTSLEEPIPAQQK